MENNIKYTNIKKKSLADALNFLGFRYYKFQNDKGETVFSFIENVNFLKALKGLLELREEVK